MANGRKMLKYQTLKENLRERIESGRYLENNCLPAERELCEEFSASGIRVGKSGMEVEQEGVL